MSAKTFLDLKHALENGETTFTIGQGSLREFCMVAKYGDANLVYSITNYTDADLPRIAPNDKPQLIALSDNDGRNIVLMNRFAFVDHGVSNDLDVEVEPYYIGNVVNALNEQLAETIVEDFKANLRMEDFRETQQESIMKVAHQRARDRAIEGDIFGRGEHAIVTFDDYIAIRSGQKYTSRIAEDYCNLYVAGLMCEKETERLIAEGILDEVEEQIAAVLRDMDESVKTVALNFEVNGKTGSAKIKPQTLKAVLSRNTFFGSYDFENSRAFTEMVNKDLLGSDVRDSIVDSLLTVHNIESITYGRATLYKKDSEPAAKKERKSADIYER